MPVAADSMNPHRKQNTKH